MIIFYMDTSVVPLVAVIDIHSNNSNSNSNSNDNNHNQISAVELESSLE